MLALQACSLLGDDSLFSNDGPAGAADLAADSDPCGAAHVQAILQSACSGCHRPGQKNGEIDDLTLPALLASDMIKGGDLAGSPVWDAVDANRMPKGSTGLPDEQKDALRCFIENGAVVSTVARVTEKVLLQAILDDLAAADAAQRHLLRYVNGAAILNAGGSLESLATTRQAVSKLVNSLSWADTVVRPVTVPVPGAPEDTLYRINLRDYQWDTHLAWDQLLARYQLGYAPTGPETGPLFKEVARETHCRMPIVTADWLVATASLAPLYYDILLYHEKLGRSARTTKELEEVVLHVSKTPATSATGRAGFSESGVSGFNRSIVRWTGILTSDVGPDGEPVHASYWESYDFGTFDTTADPHPEKNLFASPFPPGSGQSPALVFVPDGGEFIWGLPNGFQGYFIAQAADASSGDGERLDVAPENVVKLKEGVDPRIYAGRTCMHCHASGIIPKDDRVLEDATNSIVLEPDELIELAKFYLPEGQPPLRQLAEQDSKRYYAATLAAGAPPPSSGGFDQVNTVAFGFDSTVTRARAAAELGILEDTLTAAANNPVVALAVGPKVLSAFQSVDSPETMQRKDFLDAASVLVCALGLGVPVACPGSEGTCTTPRCGSSGCVADPGCDDCDPCTKDRCVDGLVSPPRDPNPTIGAPRPPPAGESACVHEFEPGCTLEPGCP